MTHDRCIILVNSNVEVVSALRRLFLRARWHVIMATSFAEAEATMKRRAVDLVIAGRRDMADGDGLAFLAQVRQFSPESIRMLLADRVDDRDTARALAQGVLHQVIPVPWDCKEVVELVVRAFQSRAAAGRQGGGLQRLLDQVDTLPALPEVYEKVRRELRKGSAASVKRISELVVQDPALTAQLLRVANAAFFARVQRVETVEAAVVALGLNMVGNLTLFVSVFRDLQPRIPDFTYRQFWSHSFGVGLAASHLQAAAGPDRQAVEIAMVSGLIHDVGKLVMAHYVPEKYASVIAAAKERQAAAATVEAEIMGVTHATVGGYLAEQWNLPPAVVEAISWHHDPGSTPKYRSLIAHVHLADEIARDVGLECGGSYQAADVLGQARIVRVPVERAAKVRATLAEYAESGRFEFPWK